ncbi:MAG: response regulator [Ignavibacteriaceae bacterium]|nr:response regulator [Ignavibacteriaceae bacterium]
MALFTNYKKLYLELQEQFNKTEEELNHYKSTYGELSSLKSEFHDTKSDYESLQSRLQSLNAELEKLQNNHFDISFLFDSKKNELDKLETDYKNLNSELEGKKKEFDSLIENLNFYKEETVKYETAFSKIKVILDKAEAEFLSIDTRKEALLKAEFDKRVEIDNLEKVISSLKFEKEKYSNLESLKLRYDELNEILSAKSIERDALFEEITNLDRFKIKLNEEIMKLRSELSNQKNAYEQNLMEIRQNFEKELSVLRKDSEDELRSYRLEIQDLLANIADATAVKLKTDALRDESFKLEQVLKSTKEEKLRTEEEVSLLRSRVDNESRRAASLEREVESLNRQLGRLNEERQVTTGVVEQMKAMIHSLSENRESIAQNITNLNIQLSEKDKFFKEMLRRQHEIAEDIQKRKVELVNMTGKLSLRQQRYADLSGEIHFLEDKKLEYESDIIRLLELQKNLFRQLNDSDEKLKELNETLIEMRRRVSEQARMRAARRKAAQSNGTSSQPQTSQPQENTRVEGNVTIRQIDEDDEIYSAPVFDEPVEAEISIGFTSSGGPKKILFAEDNEGTRVLFTRLLRESNYEVLVAANGVEALDLANKAHVDLFIVDLNMPVMNGFEFIQRIRGISAYKTSPIIALSGFAIEGQRELALKAGADEIEMKPVNKESILSKIKNYLK